jgi:membrane peptidoglycan carboxypeptidase
VYGRVTAAKTGTEGIQQGPDNGHNSDAWMVGFTPQVSAAVWVGSGDSTHKIVNSYGGDEYGRDLPGRTWQLFMTTYLQNKPALPMATTQQIKGGQNLAATPIPTHTKTTSSSSPKPSPTPTKTKNTPTPTPTPTTTTTSPTPTPCRSNPPATCGPTAGPS